MYKIKNIMGRSTYLTAAFGLLATFVASAVIPATTFADALNPLTERSLMLSSSSPGYHYLDGSGNATYAGPGTGNNGQKTGETFSFRVSTNTTDTGTGAIDTPVMAWTFQYCTTPAGLCRIPGNMLAVDPDPSTTSNLNINYTAPEEGDDFEVWVGEPGVEVQSEGWTMTTSRVIDLPSDLVNTDDEEEGYVEPEEHNFITLVHDEGEQWAANTRIKIVFKASDDNYITNPGSGAFFVKVNNYSTDEPEEMLPDSSDFIIDGGVTVANVMNDSIWIQTKVLETLYFSVGTVNPDTVGIAEPAEHGNCDPIEVNAPISMGDSNAEFSLAVDDAYDAHSYWRLSSNSSAGATVYYSGNTLSNTVGDQINAIGSTKQTSNPGSEQFGLAFTTTADTLDTNTPPGGFSANTPAPLVPLDDYNGGTGQIQDPSPVAQFAFNPLSLNDPEPFATYDDDVIDCATGKMRYLANIAANTPAGVYTSKINYIAAPQY